MKKIHLLVPCLLLVLLIISPASHAQLFKWVDEKGNIHYGDSPPDNAKLKRITGNVSSFSTVSIEPFVYKGSDSKKPGKTTVVMYSASWCGYCREAATHFKNNRIPFTEHDIEKSERGAIEYKNLKGRGVPIILIGDKRMNGFSPAAFDRIYKGS